MIVLVVWLICGLIPALDNSECSYPEFFACILLGPGALGFWLIKNWGG